MTRDPYGLTRPCDNCPFRNDGHGVRLTVGRVREIENSLLRSEFPCHKTTNVEKGGLDMSNATHCAGALILLEKLHRPSQMMRIAERLGMYDRSRLDMNAPVFDSFTDMKRASLRRHP